jgi:putative spermidine/putrescine transport system ATP-binding protein
VQALRGVSLDVRPGEFLTLLGSSGCGKTTLLNTIAGFEELHGGEVLVQGRSMAGVPAHRRNFGMVFQSYALFPHMTVGENVAYPLRLRGVSKRERRDRVRQAVAMVELESAVDRLPTQLSGGQQQRVALARALVFEPKVLLMDEPLGALDRRLRQALQFSIKRLHRELDTTIIYVTHDQEEALAMSDRIGVMRDGLIEQVDTPSAMYREPATEFVASFLGETNLLQALVVAVEDGATRFRLLDAEADLVLAGVYRPSSERCVLSVRPEGIAIVPEEAPMDLSTRVRTEIFMGDSWRYECDLPQGAPIVLRVPAEQSAAGREGNKW